MQKLIDIMLRPDLLPEFIQLRFDDYDLLIRELLFYYKSCSFKTGSDDKISCLLDSIHNAKKSAGTSEQVSGGLLQLARSFRRGILTYDNLRNEIISQTWNLRCYLCEIKALLKYFYDTTLMTTEDFCEWQGRLFSLYDDNPLSSLDIAKRNLWLVGGNYRKKLGYLDLLNGEIKVGQDLSHLSAYFHSPAKMSMRVTKCVQDEHFLHFPLEITQEGYLMSGEIIKLENNAQYLLVCEVTVDYDYLPNFHQLSVEERYNLLDNPEVFAAYLISKQFLEWGNQLDSGKFYSISYAAIQRLDAIWRVFWDSSTTSVTLDEITFLLTKLDSEKVRIVSEDYEIFKKAQRHNNLSDDIYPAFQYLFTLTKETLEKEWPDYQIVLKNVEPMRRCHDIFKKKVLNYLLEHQKNS